MQHSVCGRTTDTTRVGFIIVQICCYSGYLDWTSAFRHETPKMTLKYQDGHVKFVNLNNLHLLFNIRNYRVIIITYY